MPRGRPRKNPDDALIRSAEFIGWALGGLEREILETKDRLAALTAEAAKLRGKVGGRAERATAAAGATAAKGASKIRRNLSPEARKRISERMKKRWAEYRKNKSTK